MIYRATQKPLWMIDFSNLIFSINKTWVTKIQKETIEYLSIFLIHIFDILERQFESSWL